MTEWSAAKFLIPLCFFLFGLRLTEEGFRQASGERLRGHLGRLTEHRIQAFVLGIVMTILFQSSVATTVMLIGLTGLGFLSVQRATAVVLGADVGTALLVLIFASFVRFEAAQLAVVILILGFLSAFVFRRGRSRFMAEAFLGFGFVFYGLTLLSSMSVPLRESQLVQDLITAISQHQFLALCATVLATGFIQSSAAVIGILLGFASVGLITGVDAVPFILGANLGSTVGPVLAGLRAQTKGKRVAVLHVGMKAVGVFLLFPFASEIGELVSAHVESPPYQIAAIHIFLNLGIATLFLPLISFVARLGEHIVRDVARKQAFGPLYLDKHALDSPLLAFANVFREILRLSEIAQSMFSKVLEPFQNPSPDVFEAIEELDDQTGLLDRKIKFYLADISEEVLTEGQSQQQLELLMLTHDLKSVGDVITKEVLEVARKKHRRGLSFSQEGWREIQAFHEKIEENFSLVVASFANKDPELSLKVLRHKKHLAEFEQELGQAHLQRLQQGSQDDFDTSTIYLDMLSNLRRINSIVCKMTYPILERATRADRELP